MSKALVVSILLVFLFSCSGGDKNKNLTSSQPVKTPFSLVSNAQTHINFKNKMHEDLYFNFLNYPYVYNGGGVAVGDINNDGLEDIYFTSNEGTNKLYLNKGDFSFEDITVQAGVSDTKGWSTGVSMVDINHDGWLDIYVCKSGSLQNDKLRENKLYINQKNNTFRDEASKYGLNNRGFSTQAYFLDYDKDGDLDMYLVNHRADFRNNAHIDLENQKRIVPEFTDHLFQNNGNFFTDVTLQSGISNKAWGLSAAIGDFNQDGWPDVYVANDFLEPDFLYINNHDGTFTNRIDALLKHISTNSMGCDFADINNDFLPDLMVLEMAPADRARSKQNMPSMDVQAFNLMVNSGYHYQYMRNMLQLHNANNTYSDIGQLAGVTNTDWSWSTLIADFDNDGYNDIFVSNGIKKDLANSDFRERMKNNIRNHKKVSLSEAIDMMPSSKIANYMFLNNKDFTFKDVSKDFGFAKKINSNGTAYADFDNDGDLDLVMNNQGEVATIYQNNTQRNYVKISLKGTKKNPRAIGSKVFVYSAGNKQFKSLYTNRGYQSSVSDKLIFGLGETQKIDSICVIWNDGKTGVYTGIKINSHVTLSHDNATVSCVQNPEQQSYFIKIDPSKLGIDFRHFAVNFNDYDKQLLLPQKQSTVDNCIAVGDINNDGLEDLFLGNTSHNAAKMYLQTPQGTFRAINTALFEKEKQYNDNNALFFDADHDGDMDLYVATGNYAIPENSRLQQDRLYINDGKGHFSKSNALPPVTAVTKAIAAYDYDHDGDEDLFVGGRVVPAKYPNAPESYVLENRRGKFVNVTQKVAKDFQFLGLINDMIFSDYDQDGDKDLMVAGEWLPVCVFQNNKGIFTRKSLQSDSIIGWNQTIKAYDIDHDGDEDYLIGNYGKNNKFHPSEAKPLHIFANYFDDNDSWDTALSKVSGNNLYPARGKECSTQQTPFLADKITTYKDFANATLTDVYGKEKIENALHLKATSFHSYLMLNEGESGFSIVDFPNAAQFGPTLGFEICDINADAQDEIIGVGDIYDAEVETIRYDASRGYILSPDMTPVKDSGFILDNEAKNIKKIKIGTDNYLIVLNANSALSIFRIAP